MKYFFIFPIIPAGIRSESGRIPGGSGRIPGRNQLSGYHFPHDFLFETYRPSFVVVVGGCCEFIHMLLEHDECCRFRP
jgi:hypothetical protein